MKFIHPDHVNSWYTDYEGRVLRELLSMHENQNILTYFGVFRLKVGVTWTVVCMQRCEGALNKFVDSHVWENLGGHGRIACCWDIVRQILTGLQACHSMDTPLWHRDMKMSNSIDLNFGFLIIHSFLWSGDSPWWEEKLLLQDRRFWSFKDGFPRSRAFSLSISLPRDKFTPPGSSTLIFVLHFQYWFIWSCRYNPLFGEASPWGARPTIFAVAHIVEKQRVRPAARSRHRYHEMLGNDGIASINFWFKLNMLKYGRNI